MSPSVSDMVSHFKDDMAFGATAKKISLMSGAPFSAVQTTSIDGSSYANILEKRMRHYDLIGSKTAGIPELVTAVRNRRRIVLIQQTVEGSIIVGFIQDEESGSAVGCFCVEHQSK